MTQKLDTYFETFRRFRAEDPAFARSFWNRSDATIARWVGEQCRAADVRIGERAIATLVNMWRWDEAPETVTRAREAAKVRARLGVAGR